MAKRLTDTAIRALKPSAKRYQINDGGTPGLALRVTPNGKKLFVLFTRYPGSTSPTARALGEYDVLSLEDARKRAEEWRKLIKQGIDPTEHEARQREEEERQRAETEREEQRKRGETFEAVADAFFARIADKRRAREVERTIRREFVARWGKRPVADITREDVREVILGIERRGAPSMAHHAFKYVRWLFNWAIDSGGYDLEHSPCDRMKPTALIGVEPARQRVLTDDELFAVWRNAGRLGYPFGPMYRLILLTGARRDEIAGMRWRELHPALLRALRDVEHADLQAVCQSLEPSSKLLTIPPERFKSNASHMIPLADDALSIIATLPRFTQGDYVFSTTDGKRPVSGFSKAKARLERRVTRTLKALARQRGETTEVEPFVIHDLRRTMRTRLSALRIPSEVAEMVIGHGKRGLARVYDQHAYLDEMRDALERWAAMLRGIVEPAPSNVVRLTQAKAVTADG